MIMDTCTYNYLEPSALSGILKTVYLFLEGQRLRRTCKTLLEESSQLGFPNIKQAIANILVLKPSFTEIVKVTHADPKNAAVELKKNPPNTRAESESPKKDNVKEISKEEANNGQNKNKNKTRSRDISPEKSIAKEDEKSSGSPRRISVETVPQVYNEIEDIQIVHAVVEEERSITLDPMKIDQVSEADTGESDGVSTVAIAATSDVTKGTVSRPIIGGIQLNRNLQTADSGGQSANLRSSLHKIAIVDEEDIKLYNSFKPTTVTGHQEENKREDQSTYLDFNKVKTDLKSSDFNHRVLLLQALRWLLTKTSPKDRHTIMKEFTQHDILGLQDGKDLLESPLVCCLYSGPPNSALQEETARFVNALCSSAEGRNYIAENDNLLRVILPLVMETDENSPRISPIVREHLLVSLQKLSLRNKMRLIMIENGLPLYLVYFLSQNHEDISDYCLEYTCALLMNLCLHENARCDLLAISSEVVYMLDMFVKSSHVHCLSYMNGLMYSLFCEEEIRKKAKGSDLQTSLLEVMAAVQDEDIRLQVELILEILNGSSAAHNINSSNLGEDVEVDHFEDEIDLGDVVLDARNCDAILAGYKVVPIGTLPDEEQSSLSNQSAGNQKLLEAMNATLTIPDDNIPQDKQTTTRKTPKNPLGRTATKSPSSKRPTSKSPTPSKKSATPTRKVPTKTSKPPSNSAKSRQPSSSSTAATHLNSCPESGIRQSAAPKAQQKSCYISPYCSKYQMSGRKYTCVCYDEMQKFIRNNCVGTCPERTDQCSKSSNSKPNADEELFQSAIELLALNCCKPIGQQSVHVDCECYSTVFQSRPKVMRTP